MPGTAHTSTLSLMSALLVGALVTSGCQSRDAASESALTPAMFAQLAVPPGMVRVPGGVTQIGSNEGLPAERPVFEADVAGFFLDRTPVTVSEFAAFVDSTGYTTEAERFGDAGLLVDKQWALVRGANWKNPRGAAAEPASGDHPVTQVSWNDADAFCRAAGKRLPTEVEWEHAARHARDARARYPWGEHLTEEGHHHANTWQGVFPDSNRNEDGFLFTSPVGAFGETELGLTDMGGNVWEWTADWFRPYGRGYDDYTPGAGAEKVQRGGSFLCNEDWCHGFRVSARSHSSPETSLFHVGFRCARSAEAR